METGNLKSVNHRLNMLGFYNWCTFLVAVSTQNEQRNISMWSNSTIYIFFFFFYNLLQIVLWSVLHCFRALSPRFLLLKTSALQSHVRPGNVYERPEFPITDWIANLCTVMCGEVKHVVKLVDYIVQHRRSGAPTDVIWMPFNWERPQPSIDA